MFSHATRLVTGGSQKGDVVVKTKSPLTEGLPAESALRTRKWYCVAALNPLSGTLCDVTSAVSRGVDSPYAADGP